MDEASQAHWTAYLDRKRAERLAEAGLLWAEFERRVGDAETVVALDFRTLCPDRGRADALRGQLSEHYRVELEPAENGYWMARGTTRPYGVTLSAQSHLAWVEFMCDVAASHGCVFSTWSVTAPALELVVDSEHFEAAI